MENLELENLGVWSNTSEFDQNASEKNSVFFITKFSVLCIVQNGKLRVEKPGKYVLQELQVFNFVYL